MTENLKTRFFIGWLAIVWLALAATCWGQHQTRRPGSETIRFHLPAGKILSSNPIAIDADAKLFNFSYADFEDVNLPDTRANAVWFLGYNVTQGGDRENVADPSLHVAWESYFVVSSIPCVEWYVQFRGTDGVVHRPFGGAWPRDGTATGANTQVQGTQINLLNWAGDQKLKHDFASGAIDVFDGVFYRQETNNTPVWQQRNAGNTAFINLPFIDSDDRCRIAAPGVFVSTTPAAGTYAGEFFTIQSTSAATGNKMLAIRSPNLTGNLYAWRGTGAINGEYSGSLANQNTADAGAHAISELSVGGTSAGDPFTRYVVTSGATWAAGVDNSDSDKYKISNATTPSGGSDALTIDTSEIVDHPVGYIGTKVVTNDTDGGTLAAADCRGQVRTNTGASGGQTYNLPAVTAGMTITILLSAADDVNINPDNADQILVLTNAVGDAISSDAGQGHWITLIGIDSTNWMMLDHDGIWTDVN